MLVPPKHQQGFTIVEILVTLGIASIIMASVIALYSTGLLHTRETLERSKMSQSLQMVLEIMANDIRRAGYWSAAVNDLESGENNNPFMTANSDIQIGNEGSCILFTYDHNNDGTLNTSANDDERFGFRLNNNAVQSKPEAAAFDCTADSNAWLNLTNPKTIKITQLIFTQTNDTIDIDGDGSSHSKIHLRNINISITGELPNDPTVTRTLTQRVQIRNHKFTTQ